MFEAKATHLRKTLQVFRITFVTAFGSPQKKCASRQFELAFSTNFRDLSTNSKFLLSLAERCCQHDLPAIAQHCNTHGIAWLPLVECIGHSLKIRDDIVIETNDDVTALETGDISGAAGTYAADLYAVWHRREIGNGAEICARAARGGAARRTSCALDQRERGFLAGYVACDVGDQVCDLHEAGRIDLFPVIGRFVIIGVHVREKVQHGYVLHVERRVIACAEAIAHEREIDVVFVTRALHERWPLAGCPHAVNDQRTFSEPSHHIHVQHGAGMRERRVRVICVERASRSEERRVGEEWRGGGWPGGANKKT